MKSKLLSCCWALVLPAALVAGGCSGDSGTDCPVGQTDCDGVCVDTSTDRDNCGTCGNACLGGQHCAAGACVACDNECEMGEKRCAPGSTTQYQECGDPDGDTCLEWAPAQACAAGEICDAGDCITACSDECGREDAQVCDPEGANGYRVCGDFDDDDCLEYGDLVGCDADETCVEGQCVEACSDECPAQGDRQCAAPPDNGFLICGDYDSDSCLEWGGLTLCPQGETCSGGVCSSDCSDDCAQGERVCDGNGFRTCGAFDQDPCLDWSGVTQCAAYEVCSDGYCETACSDECDQGSKRCSGEGADEGYDVCGNYDADPCLEWGNHTTCGAGEACVNGQCVEDCQDECPNAGARICDGDGYRTCRDNVDGDSCLEWSDITACPDGEACFDGQCSEYCIQECTEGDRECYGAGWRECTAVPDPQNPAEDCWVWGAVTACDPYYACNPDADPVECQLTCSDECPQGGARQCTGDLSGYQECSAGHDADPCLEWGAAVGCPEFYECDPGSAQCVEACDDECGLGNFRCTADGTGTLECVTDFDADPCTEWGNETPCPDGETCSNGECAPTCSDECDTAGAIVCSADDPTHKTYRICGNYDADDCLELSDSSTCGYGEQCDADPDAGPCVVVCEDECPAAGALQCNAGSVEICDDDAADADECLEWSVQTVCEGATPICYQASCWSDTPPSTVRINEVLYDNDGSDAAAGNFLFIELYGVADQNLSGFALHGVNGNSEVADPLYRTIPLDGYTIPADGHFVIAHPDGDAGLQAEADLLTADVDLQNGPDNLQVVWAGSVVVDALGYDTFAADDNWAGEGASYEDAAPDAAPVDGVMFCLSRGVDHADTDVNINDFYRRTLNNCSPGWEGPGAIVAQSFVYGGWSTPALDADGHVWTVDSWGWINVTSPDLTDADDVSPPVGVSFQSSVAVDTAADPNVAYVGSDAGVYAYTLTVDSEDPFQVTLNAVAGWPVLAGSSVRATPAFSWMDGAVFFGTQGDGFYGFNADGSERFHHDTGGNHIDSSAAIGYLATGEEVAVFGVGGMGAGEVVAVCTQATGSAPCANAGDVLWSDASPAGGCNGSPAISEGQVFIACDDGLLYGYDLETGAALTGFPVDITNEGTAPDGAFIDACSPVAMPDGAGNTLIRITTRSDAADLWLLSYDGTEVSGAAAAFGTLMSSPALGADLSTVYHAGYFLLNYGFDYSLQWYAVVNDNDPLALPADAWALSSPTWVPSATEGYGLILVVDPAGSDMWTVLATSPPATSAGAFPMLHGDWNNSGSGW